MYVFACVYARTASLVHRKQNYTIPNALPLISVTWCRQDGCACACFYFSVTRQNVFAPPKNKLRTFN